jgi:hypothetical protein
LHGGAVNGATKANIDGLIPTAAPRFPGVTAAATGVARGGTDKG